MLKDIKLMLQDFKHVKVHTAQSIVFPVNGVNITYVKEIENDNEQGSYQKS